MRMVVVLLAACCATPLAAIHPVPEVVDVAVVGGGLEGLVTAYELRQRGHR